MYPNNSSYNRQSGMDYLNSISAQPQPEQSVNQTPVNPPSSSKKKTIIFAIIAFSFVTILGLVAIIAAKDKKVSDTSEIITAEMHKQKEKLNSKLASLAEKNPEYEYDSPSIRSHYYSYLPQDVIAEFDIDAENLDFSNTHKVDAMNSNIMNYYLDREDSIIAIVDPAGITGRGKKTNTIFIYGSAPRECDYVGFMPADFDSDGLSKDKTVLPEELMVVFTRSELLNQLSESAEFYVIQKHED